MPVLAIAYGVSLVVVGLAAFVLTGSHALTALIPCAFGILAIISGVVARREKYLKHAMHAAAVVGLIGFLGTVSGVSKTAKLILGAGTERPAAAIAQAVMAVLSAAFLGFCVKSFRDARRARTAAK